HDRLPPGLPSSIPRFRIHATRLQATETSDSGRTYTSRVDVPARLSSRISLPHRGAEHAVRPVGTISARRHVLWAAESPGLVRHGLGVTVERVVLTWRDYGYESIH